MQQHRRKFLQCLLAGVATTAGLGGYWLGTSEKRSVRWLRRAFADCGRSAAPAPVKPKPEQWSDNQITICWLGHATALINFYGIHILTDPTFGDRIGISLGLGTAGPKRYIAPALRFHELPPIDVLLLSHAHMDHLDLPSLEKFAPGTFTVTAKSTSDLLVGTRLKQATELPWNGKTTFKSAKGELHIEAFQVKHWGKRWPSEMQRGYNGYVIRREGKAILFGGDTAHTPLFADVRSRGPFEAAIMPIAAYQPWIAYHCTPEQAADMVNRAGARYIVPVHHQTFRLSDEPMNEPIERLEAAFQRESERIALRKVGESFVCPKV
jgi:L-ascorbate metabolism protein UlaG (beta-lactamase superfamily)